MSELQEIKDDVKDILRLMNGNGKLGIIAKCQLAYDWMLQVKNDKHTLGMYIYRSLLGIGIAYIAVMLHLK